MPPTCKVPRLLHRDMSSSSSDESSQGMDEPHTSCESCSVSPKPIVKKKVVRFTTAQKAFMNAYYDQGMKGTGKHYKHLIKRAAIDAGLSTAQVKVCRCRI